MSSRRYRSLHFGDTSDKNVVYHREHRSKLGREKRISRYVPGYDDYKIAKKGIIKEKAWKKIKRDIVLQ